MADCERGKTEKCNEELRPRVRRMDANTALVGDDVRSLALSSPKDSGKMKMGYENSPLRPSRLCGVATTGITAEPEIGRAHV